MRELARYISIGIALCAFLAVGVAACTSSAPEPTPDVQAVVEAAVAKALPTVAPTSTPDIDATVRCCNGRNCGGRPDRRPRTNSYTGR